MATGDVAKFFDKVDKDKALQAELKNNFGDIENLAKKHGFNFTKDEMLGHLQTRWGVTKGPTFHNDTCTFP